MMRFRLSRAVRGALFACVALAAAACGSKNDCLPAIAGAADCPQGIFIDGSTTDPLCVTSSGLPVCRGSLDAACYMCTGGSFTDNCIIRSPDNNAECVHSCDKC